MRRLLLIPLVLIVASCGGTTHKATGPPLQTIQVTEKEFSIRPNTIAVRQTGTYRFDVTNNGQITHAFEVEGSGVNAKTADIAPGKSATLTVDFGSKGKYEAFCPIDGHRSKGMEATIDVSLNSVPPPAGTTTSRTGPVTTGTTTTG